VVIVSVLLNERKLRVAMYGRRESKDYKY
jgi:hypothetical protein